MYLTISGRVEGVVVQRLDREGGSVVGKLLVQLP